LGININTQRMNAILEFNPETFSKETLRLILASAQKWKCTPEQALNRLLDNLAKRSGFTPPKS
jgi:hypothetical protein